MRALPTARAAATEPAAIRSSNDTISALMKPRWKSVWMTPAASGAVAPTGMVQARVSLGPAVRKVSRPRVRKPTRASWSRPGSPRPNSASSSAASSSGSSARAASVLAARNTASAGATRLAQPLPQALIGQFVGVDVEHVDERLGRQQLQLAQVGQVDAGRGGPGEQGGPAVQHLLRLGGRAGGAAL